jgi:hypothetical protein
MQQQQQQQQLAVFKPSKQEIVGSEVHGTDEA